MFERWLQKPVMEELQVSEALRDITKATERVTSEYNRRMTAYRVQVFLTTCFYWTVIAIFLVGVFTVFGVGK